MRGAWLAVARRKTTYIHMFASAASANSLSFEPSGMEFENLPIDSQTQTSNVFFLPEKFPTGLCVWLVCD